MKKFLIAAITFGLVIVLASCGGGGGSSGGGGFVPIGMSAPPVPEAPAPDRALSAVTIGVQWPTGGFNFSTECRTPNTGGTGCYHFPNGGRIWNISWQSSIKPDHDEVLLLLMMSPDGKMGGAASSILNTHHTGGKAGSCGSIISKDVVLQGFVNVPAGWYVWVYGEGNVAGAFGGVEIQTTLFLEGAANGV